MTESPQTALHSMRLFPKLQGATAYGLSGIAARCDWVLHSDMHPPFTHLHRAQNTDAPLHIFLSLRNPFAALTAFESDVLPKLHKPFVLVSGSEDCTLPRQVDQRWRSFSDTERRTIAAILAHPLLVHWFTENLDDDSDPRFSPLPTGMVYPEAPPTMRSLKSPPTIHDRPLQVLCGHRSRIGPQWDLRRAVTAYAQTDWASFCTIPVRDQPEADFLALMQSHTFVLCVEGGGLDPSPKAWQAILHGAIPIVRKTGTYKAYSQLPIAFVDSWQADSLSPARLLEWRENLAAFYDLPALRSQTMARLGLTYWWDQITAMVRK